MLSLSFICIESIEWIYHLPFVVDRFKHNGDNFHVSLLSGDKLISDVSVPEDLVQIQAYLRWEKNGKQMYTPEQEKASTMICYILLIVHT